MTNLNKTIHRTTSAQRHEAGKTRAVIITLAPPAFIGLRLKGTKTTYFLEAEVAYELAIRSYTNEVEREAIRIKKSEGCKISTARVKAREKIARWSRSLLQR
jgi:hypothetical protein